MRRLATALIVCVTVSVSSLPDLVSAGGRSFQRGVQPHAGGPPPGSFQPIPLFRPVGAFGSPGGFPLEIEPPRPVRPIRGFPRHAHDRFKHLQFSPSFPVTTFWYSTWPTYSPPAETQP